MLSLNQTFEDTRAIKVLVVPIGENSLFESHFNVVSRLRELPMYELTKPSIWKSQNQSFKHFDWSTGNLLFEYLRYDRVPNGPGDLDDFQCSRRVLIIMGLVNYPELGDANIEEELNYFARRHENVVLCRVFVFNNSFELTSAPLKGPKSDPDSLVIFPPEGECEGGSMVAVHLQEVMAHASVKVIESLDRQMRSCEEARSRGTIPQGLALSSYHDDMELSLDADSTATNNSRSAWAARKQGALKKRLQERLKKWMGDLCLQVCSPVDALEYFTNSISESRATGKGASAGDCLWLAGALEGFVTAALMLLRLNLSVEEILSKEIKAIQASYASEEAVLTLHNKVILIAEERALEALSLYSKNIVFCSLEVECSLRLARMHEVLDSNTDSMKKVLDNVMRAASVPGLNPQQQIECVLEGGLICRRMGMKRKYALLLYVAALMSAENENPQLAYALMRNACTQYGVTITGETSTASSRVTTWSMEDEQEGSAADDNSWLNNLTDNVAIRDAGASWACMRRAIFGYVAYTARQSGDNVASIRFTSALLRLMQQIESSNIRDYGVWIPLLEQYYQSDYNTIPLGAYPANLDDISSAATMRMSICENNDSHELKVPGMNGVSFSLPPPITHSDSALGKLSGRPRPGRFSISSLKEFEVNASLSQPRTQSSIASSVMGSSSVFGIPGGSNTSSLFHGHSAVSSAATLEASKSGEEDAMKMADMVNDPTEVLKSGLRRIAAPTLPPRIAAFVRDRSQTLRNRIKARQFHLKGLKPKKDEDGNSGILDEGVAAIAKLELIRDKRGPLPLDPREELLLTLQIMLESASIPNDQQDEALAMLEVIARQVDPCCAVDLPVLADSVRPVLLPLDSVRPVRLQAESTAGCEIVKRLREKEYAMAASVSTNAHADSHAHPGGRKSSALFYDPFAAQRAKDFKSKSVIEVIWSVGVVGSIMVILNNPLAVPITYDAVSVLLEGPDHIAFDVNAIIPPFSPTFELLLPVKPLQQGILSVQGIKVCVRNAVTVVRIDSTGKCLARIRPEIKPPARYPNKLIEKEKSDAVKSDDSLKVVVVGIETNSISVVGVGLTMHLTPNWKSPTAFAQSQAAANCNTTILLVLIPGETRTESISLIENVCVGAIEGLQIESLALSHCRIVAHQYIAHSKTVCQSYVLREFGSPFENRAAANSGSFSGQTAVKMCAPDWTLPLQAGNLSLACWFDFILVPGLQSIKLEFDILTNKDTEFDKIADSDVDDRAVSVFCRRTSIVIQIVQEEQSKCVELVNAYLIPANVKGSSALALQIRNGTAGDIACSYALNCLKHSIVNISALSQQTILIPVVAVANIVSIMQSLRWEMISISGGCKRFGTIDTKQFLDKNGKLSLIMDDSLRSCHDWGSSNVQLQISRCGNDASRSQTLPPAIAMQVLTREFHLIKLNMTWTVTEDTTTALPTAFQVAIVYTSVLQAESSCADHERLFKDPRDLICSQAMVSGKLHFDSSPTSGSCDHVLRINFLIPGYYLFVVAMQQSLQSGNSGTILADKVVTIHAIIL